MLILPFDSVDFGDTPMIRPIQIWVRIPSSSFPSLVCMWPSPQISFSDNLEVQAARALPLLQCWRGTVGRAMEEKCSAHRGPKSPHIGGVKLRLACGSCCRLPSKYLPPLQVHNDPQCGSAHYTCLRSVSLFLSGEHEIRLAKEVTHGGVR